MAEASADPRTLPTAQTQARHPSFGEQAMAQWNCGEPAWRHRIFWRALPRVAIPLASLVWLVRREFFAPDLALIRELGQTRDVVEFNVLIEQFRDEMNKTGGWARNGLRLRVSGRRLRRLRWELR